MRPQDVLILMGIISFQYPQGIWAKSENENNPEINSKKKMGLPIFFKNNKELAQALKLSDSEVSESLYRSEYAGLIESVKSKKINKRAFLDFVIYGLKYVFPVHPGAVGRGIATAHSAQPLKEKIVSDENYIWEHPDGTVRGQIIKPLFNSVPFVVENSQNLYELMSLVDAIRTGSPRIVSLAIEMLEKRINNSW
jgi:DNA-binding transcriptional ArsR family regulator